MFRCRNYQDIWYFLDVQVSKLLRYLIFYRWKYRISKSLQISCSFIDVKLLKFLQISWIFINIEVSESSQTSCISLLLRYRNLSPNILYFIKVKMFEFSRYFGYNRDQDVWISHISWIQSRSRYRNYLDILYFLDVKMSKFPKNLKFHRYQDVWNSQISLYFIDVEMSMSEFSRYLKFHRCRNV